MDKHDFYVNCDSVSKLFGQVARTYSSSFRYLSFINVFFIKTADCHDTSLEDEDFADTYNSWILAITRDSFYEDLISCPTIFGELRECILMLTYLFCHFLTPLFFFYLALICFI